MAQQFNFRFAGAAVSWLAKFGRNVISLQKPDLGRSFNNAGDHHHLGAYIKTDSVIRRGIAGSDSIYIARVVSVNIQ